MPDIVSPRNERVKYAVRLRERRFRQQENAMLVEGCYELTLALRSGLRPMQVFLCEALAREWPDSLLTLRPLTVGREAFEKMSYRENPDGWLAIFPLPRRALTELRLSANPLLVLTEAVEKPGNLGAILRTADAAGVDGLLVCDARTDLYNPNVVRASRGALFTVPAVETSNEEALSFLRAQGVSILATTPRADISYTEINLNQPLCIAVGTEDEGLSDFWLKQADWKVRIPMRGYVNSLNVAAAAAIVLYEAVRQRGV